MRQKPIFNWDKDNGVATCTINTNDGYSFTGISKCAPQDSDMCSEKTGCEIALNRAYIKLLKHYRNTLKERLAALNQLYYSINKSNKFNEKSYENKMLQRQINLIKFDLTTVNNRITDKEQMIKEYIAKKEIFYKHIRAGRTGQK